MLGGCASSLKDKQADDTRPALGTGFQGTACPGSACRSVTHGHWGVSLHSVAWGSVFNYLLNFLLK